MTTETAIASLPGGVRLHLLVQPRASSTGIAGLHEGRIKLRLAAPPVDGAANEALIAFLSKALGTAKTSVHITSGRSGRKKTVEIMGVTRDQVGRLVARGSG